VCPVCGTPTPKRKARVPRENETKDQRKERWRREKQQHRTKWSPEERKSDRKVGTGYLGSKPDPENEERKISNEYKRIGLTLSR